MIAFIVIGKNESKHIAACIESIINTIEQNSITEYEIIYVDSASIDNSVDLVRTYKNVKIFQITGCCNPAIGRNIGASETNADILFFIDADMEISPGFLAHVLTAEKKLTYDFVSGQFENYYYDSKGNFQYKELYHKNLKEKEVYQVTTGGLFLINRSLWESVNGFRTKFKTGEDLDLGLRLAMKGIKLQRKPVLMAVHYTMHYHSQKRIWNDLLSGKTIYSRGLLYRTHLFNKYMYLRLLNSDPTVPVLVATIGLSFILKTFLFIPLYILITASALLFFRKQKTFLEFILRMLYQIIRDILTILTFFFFYPQEKNAKYIKVR